MNTTCRFLRIFGGWGITLVLAGLLSAAIAAWGVYSPNKQYSDAAVFTAAVSLAPLANSCLSLEFRQGVVYRIPRTYNNERVERDGYFPGESRRAMVLLTAMLEMFQ